MTVKYLVEKIPMNDLTRASLAMNSRGGQGWRAIFFTPFNQDLLVVYENATEMRPSAFPDGPEKRTAPEKKAPAKKKKTTKKTAKS